MKCFLDRRRERRAIPDDPTSCWDADAPWLLSSDGYESRNCMSSRVESARDQTWVESSQWLDTRKEKWSSELVLFNNKFRTETTDSLAKLCKRNLAKKVFLKLNLRKRIGFFLLKKSRLGKFCLESSRVESELVPITRLLAFSNVNFHKFGIFQKHSACKIII